MFNAGLPTACLCFLATLLDAAPYQTGDVIALECAGDLPGPRLLDGRTVERDAILANTSANSGTRWRAHLLATLDEPDDIDAPSAPQISVRRNIVAKLPAAQIETSLRGWDVSVTDRLKRAVR